MSTRDMRVILDVLQGPRKGRSFVFDRHDTFIVGRSRFVHCPMPEDSALSRDHFLIEINPPRCEVRDLGSTNGTFVNERRVERVRLSSGDRIAAGQSVFQVRVEAAVAGGETSRPTASATAAPADGDLRPATAADPLRRLRRAGPARRRRRQRPRLRRRASRSSGSATPAAPRSPTTAPAGPPLHDPPRAGPRGDGRRLPGPAQPDRPAGRAEADRPRERRGPVGHRPVPPRDVGHQPAEAPEHRRVARAGDDPRPVLVRDGVRRRGRTWRPSPTPTRAATRSHQACRMACQVLKGLEQAHSLGFVHRDIKPENILIGRSPEGLVAKISDFGLAKSFRGLGLSGLTFSGEMRGTVPFMPPEQMLDFKTVAPLRRPLRDRRDALLPDLLPVHLRPGRRGRRPDPHAPGGAPRPDPQAPGRRSRRARRRPREVPRPRPEGPLPHRRRDAPGAPAVLLMRRWMDGSARANRRAVTSKPLTRSCCRHVHFADEAAPRFAVARPGPLRLLPQPREGAWST